MPVLTKTIALDYNQPMRVTLDGAFGVVKSIQADDKDISQRMVQVAGSLIPDMARTVRVRSISMIAVIVCALLTSITAQFQWELVSIGLALVGLFAGFMFVFTLRKPYFLIPNSTLVKEAQEDLEQDKNSYLWKSIIFEYACFAQAKRVYNEQTQEIAWVDLDEAYKPIFNARFEELTADLKDIELRMRNYVEPLDD